MGARHSELNLETQTAPSQPPSPPHGSSLSVPNRTNEAAIFGGCGGTQGEDRDAQCHGGHGLLRARPHVADVERKRNRQRDTCEQWGWMEVG